MTKHAKRQFCWNALHAHAEHLAPLLSTAINISTYSAVKFASSVHLIANTATHYALSSPLAAFPTPPPYLPIHLPGSRFILQVTEKVFPIMAEASLRFVEYMPAPDVSVSQLARLKPKAKASRADRPTGGPYIQSLAALAWRMC